MPSVLQRGLDALDAAEADPFDRAKARALLRGYHVVNGPWIAQLKILFVEAEFLIPLYNPETTGQSKSFDIAGKIDVGAKDRCGIIIEHKTTSDSLEPDSQFWDRLVMDTQISAYHLGAEYLGLVPEKTIYDVTRKPFIHPNPVPVLDDHGLKIYRAADGSRALNKNGSPRQTAAEGLTLDTRPMEPEEYETKLIDDILSRPTFYFARREVARLVSDLAEYLDDAWAVSQQILYSRSRRIWPRNPDACNQFGICEFFDLCAGHASLDGLTYGPRAKRHAELANQGNGRQLLTASRLRDLRRCLRLHYNRYEALIQRLGPEAESLRFGHLWHLALEAYYGAAKEAAQS